MFTRKEFEDLRIQCATEMAKDVKLQKDALDVLVRADSYKWIHQTTWFGEPILNLPQDMFVIQEIIFNTRPDYIIEVGVAWGGALLFYSTLMEVLGGKVIIGIDSYVPDDLKERVGAFGRVSERITWINNSSTDDSTMQQVESIIGDSKKLLVILDSNHTHHHVLAEMRIYSKYIGKGFYMVCGDTIIESIPEQKHGPRPWGPGNSPKTARDQFLSENDRFEIDKQICNKLLLTCNVDGYLRCTRDL